MNDIDQIGIQTQPPLIPLYKWLSVLKYLALAILSVTVRDCGINSSSKVIKQCSTLTMIHINNSFVWIKM